MGDVSAVFDKIGTRPVTKEEISRKCGLSVSRVQDITAFLEEFGLVRTVGSKVVTSEELAGLSEG